MSPALVAALIASGAAAGRSHGAGPPGPRFIAHGSDVERALLGADNPPAAAVAREVARRGFYAGPPIGAGDCAGCHRDVAAQWAASAHRFSSFANPYYRVAVEEFRREKGAGASRFCGNCHEPALVATGAMDGPIDRAAPAAQAGITCRTCHGTTHTDLEGNGRYVVALADVPLDRGTHGAALRPPGLGDSRFCAGCHKVGLGPEVTGERWLRGQNDWDAWHGSGVAGNGAASIHRPAETKRCQDCHMPLEPAVLGDLGAKAGLVRSHRFLGANTALPRLRGDADHEARTAAFLRGRASLALAWSGERRVDAILRARGVGHRLPGGTMDSNEVWLEVKALDAAGRVLAVSGDRGRDGTLSPDTHLVRVQPVDADGAPLARRDPQHMRGVVFDTALTPSDPQVVRFEVPPRTAAVEARLLYRKFSAAYARLACADLPAATRRRCLDLPITEIARARLAAGAPAPADFETLVDWGIALADATADHAHEAEGPLGRARDLAPGRPEAWLGLARLAVRLGRTDDVLVSAAAARARAPAHPAADLLEARALLEAYRARPARAVAERLVARLPSDRAALALVARARGLDGDPAGALAAADRLLAVDPESEDGHYHRAQALGELGRPAEAAAALDLYDRYRAPVERDLDLRNRWRRLRIAATADESEPCHTHGLRPVR